MLKDTWRDAGRLESLFLEIVDDPVKKEVLLYPICYCQLVRKEGSFEVDLQKLINCANKTFRITKGMWQDVLLELDLFQILTPSGEVIYGKDVLRVESPENLKICFLPEYREVFYEVYSKFLKYWTVLSKISSYSRKDSPSEAVYLSALIFNEELFCELVHYCTLQAARFPKDGFFFNALKEIGEFYRKAGRRLEVKHLSKAMSYLENTGDMYRGVNTGELRRDLEHLMREVTKNGRYFVIKIRFSARTDRGESVLRRIVSKVIDGFNRIRGRRWGRSSPIHFTAL